MQKRKLSLLEKIIGVLMIGFVVFVGYVVSEDIFFKGDVKAIRAVESVLKKRIPAYNPKVREGLERNQAKKEIYLQVTLHCPVRKCMEGVAELKQAWTNIAKLAYKSHPTKKRLSHVELVLCPDGKGIRYATYVKFKVSEFQEKQPVS